MALIAFALVISIHAPTRGATSFIIRDYFAINYFNPRSHERSDADCLQLHFYHLNFNPRSHERSDKAWFEPNAELEEISIHAPTRGATDKVVVKAPTAVFQSTLPREERPCQEHQEIQSSKISIHAPTRGATGDQARYKLILSDFNPRSHERSDSNIAQKICLFLYNTDNKYIIR